jgi:SNF2 family DNA or RNA helicase
MMKVKIQESEVEITADGLEFLRLKTELSKRIGSIVRFTTRTAHVPLSSLPLIKDLLHLENVDADPINARIASFELHATAREKAREILEQDINEGLPEKWSSTLDPAQATAVNVMTLPSLLGICLFDEQGSGKTVMTIASFDVLKKRNLIDKMVVVCPKSMVSEWPKDIEKFLGIEYNIVVAEGTKQQKYESALKNFDVLVTNYEGVDAMLNLLFAVSERNRLLLVVDESYYLKNGDSVRSSKVGKLRQRCERCFVLCGTPAPNSSHDLIHQFDLADLGYTFAGFTKSKEPSEDWEKISELIESKGLFIRRLKSEILSFVPEKNFHVISIPLKGRQALMYEQARSELVLQLKSLDNESFKKNLTKYFQRRSVLMQICVCPLAIDPTFSGVPVKYEVLDVLLDKLISDSRKVIIWSFYRKSLDEIIKRYERYNPVRVDGSVATSLRRQAVKSFQENPKVMLFVGNPSAAGAGITLHAAYDAIYVSYSNQAAPYLQSLDRIHRRGQISEHVNYYLIACQGTIEEGEIIRLRQKEVSQHNLLGDHIPWPTSLDDALQELSKNV